MAKVVDGLVAAVNADTATTGYSAHDRYHERPRPW